MMQELLALGYDALRRQYVENIPSAYRVFGEAMLGRKEPITERDFSTKELDAINQAAVTALDRKPIEGADTAFGISPRSIQYNDYPVGYTKDNNKDPWETNYMLGEVWRDPATSAQLTLGRTSPLTPMGGGAFQLNDRYKFNDNLRELNEEREFAGQPESIKQALQVGDTEGALKDSILMETKDPSNPKVSPSQRALDSLMYGNFYKTIRQMATELLNADSGVPVQMTLRPHEHMMRKRKAN